MKVELAKWHEDETMPDSAKAKLFGELVKRSAPIVEHYMSDLYRDGQYLDKYVKSNGDWFYYAVDAWGTHIGQHEVNLEFRKTAQYRVTISHEEQVWYAEFENLLDPHEDCTPKWCEAAHEYNSRCPKAE